MASKPVYHTATEPAFSQETIKYNKNKIQQPKKQADPQLFPSKTPTGRTHLGQAFFNQLLIPHALRLRLPQLLLKPLLFHRLRFPGKLPQLRQSCQPPKSRGEREPTTD